MLAMGAMRVFLATLLFVGLVRARSDGAPTAACESMTPQHGVGAQNDTSPYILEAVQEGEVVHVTIKAEADDSFKGFFLQARDENDDAIGTFEIDTSMAKIISCPENSSGNENAVTHTSSADKTEIMAMWTPPGGNARNITFTLTTVSEKETFWVKQTLEFSMNAATTVSQSILTFACVLVLSQLFR
ncbi:hypothetical protein B566_EDAN002342 [Ephemera danica]|nr:hypothetical protein B566_EDAN002342 [Ephemera danica]